MENVKNENVEKNQNGVDAELEKMLKKQDELILQNLKLNFKTNTYARSVIAINLLNNEQLKSKKDEKQVLKNLTSILENGIKYAFKNGVATKSINIGNFNFDNFIKVLKTITTNNFDNLLKYIDVDTQKSCLSEAILENNKAKNITQKTFEYKINTMQVVKSFIKFIDASFNKKYNI